MPQIVDTSGAYARGVAAGRQTGIGPALSAGYGAFMDQVDRRDRLNQQATVNEQRDQAMDQEFIKFTADQEYRKDMLNFRKGESGAQQERQQAADTRADEHLDLSRRRVELAEQGQSIRAGNELYGQIESVINSEINRAKTENAVKGATGFLSAGVQRGIIPPEMEQLYTSHIGRMDYEAAMAFTAQMQDQIAEQFHGEKAAGELQEAAASLVAQDPQSAEWVDMMLTAVQAGHMSPDDATDAILERLQPQTEKESLDLEKLQTDIEGKRQGMEQDREKHAATMEAHDAKMNEYRQEIEDTKNERETIPIKGEKNLKTGGHYYDDLHVLKTALGGGRDISTATDLQVEEWVKQAMLLNRPRVGESGRDYEYRMTVYAAQLAVQYFNWNSEESPMALKGQERRQ